MTTIKWNDKEYKMPFDADYTRQKADTFKEEIIVKNRFSGEQRCCLGSLLLSMIH